MTEPVFAFDFSEYFGDSYLDTLDIFKPGGQSDDDATRFVRLGGLQPGDLVLDIGCGEGRLTRRLAGAGIRVRGIDSSPLLIDRARELNGELAGSSFEVGDMRSLEGESPVDCALFAMDAFGYFEDDVNEAVLAGVANLVRPGGAVVLEVTSRELATRALPGNDVLEWDGNLLVDQSDFDVVTGRAHGVRTLVRADGRRSVARYSLRLYGVHELVDLLKRVGARDVGVVDQDDVPPHLGSQRLTYVARFA